MGHPPPLWPALTKPAGRPTGRRENPHPGDVFQRLYLTGSASMVVPPAAPESKQAQKSSRAAAAALGADSWQA